MKKRRFKSDGCCKLCGEVFTGGKISGHLEKCRETLFEPGDEQSIKMMHILVKSKYDPQYWLHIAICSDLELDSLDTFLRNVWLECCGHLSQFKINGKSYEDSAPSPGDLFFADEFQTQSTYIELNKILNIGTKFDYIYDFGSSTELELEVLDIFPASTSKGKIILLAHNKKPEIPCSNCGKPATQLCQECQFNGLPLCEKCAPKHGCDEDFMIPLVNSPRTGVCGYCGPVPFESGDMNMISEYSNKNISSSFDYDEEEDEYYEDIFLKHPELFQEPFTLDDILPILWGDKDKDTQEEIKEELEVFLFESEEFLGIYTPHNDDYIFHYLPTAFKGAQFCIKPTKEEINKGILIPGHRFEPYIDYYVLPSSSELRDGKKTISKRQIKSSIKQILPYHILLGIERMFEYLISDNSDNIPDLSKPFDINKEYTLTVMDMKDFYKKNKFKNGDMIIVKVEDYIDAKLSISYYSEKKATANKSKRKKWCKLFSQGLKFSIQQYEDAMYISKEITTALLLHKNFLLNNPVITLDDFLEQSKKYYLKPWRENEYIIWDDSPLPNFKDESDKDYEFEDFEEDYKSEDFKNTTPSKLDSIDILLAQLNVNINKPELESFIRNEFFTGNQSKENLWKCLFVKNINYTPEQEILLDAMKKYFDELWEKISNSYNLSDDKINGPVRRKALKIKEKLILWLRDIEPKLFDYGRIPKVLEELLNESYLIKGIIMMLDDPDEIITKKEIKLMNITIEQCSELFEVQMKMVEIIIQ